MSRSTKNLTILVVDDDKTDRESVCRLLEECGYGVVEAAGYWEALKSYEQHGDKVKLLLTAIALPGNNGYELASALFRKSPNLKVLFLSGRTGAQVSRFYNMPVTGHHILTKPIDAAELLDRVRRTLRLRQPVLRVKGAPGSL